MTVYVMKTLEMKKRNIDLERNFSTLKHYQALNSLHNELINQMNL